VATPLGRHTATPLGSQPHRSLGTPLAGTPLGSHTARSVVLAGEGVAALVVVEALEAQSPGARSIALRIAVIRRAFPRGDDEDLNLRAPRDGPGGLPPDLNVRAPADDPGVLPGRVVWYGGQCLAEHAIRVGRVVDRLEAAEALEIDAGLDLLGGRLKLCTCAF
jgi:hypothetical protein